MNVRAQIAMHFPRMQDGKILEQYVGNQTKSYIENKRSNNNKKSDNNIIRDIIKMH